MADVHAAKRYHTIHFGTCYDTKESLSLYFGPLYFCVYKDPIDILAVSHFYLPYVSYPPQAVMIELTFVPDK